MCVPKVLEVQFNSYFRVQTNFNCAVVILVLKLSRKGIVKIRAIFVFMCFRIL